MIPNIRHLAALAATVEHGSLTRAARSVNLTQPALTQAIARLEREIGCSLFERGKGGMAPTEAAHLLAPRAARAIARIGSGRITGTQVRAFLAVARSGSLAAGAEQTGLSSASLHRAIADLSLVLGQRLIEKRGRQLILTPAGRRRLRDFGVALAELRYGFDEIAAWQGRRAGRITIGAMPLSRARWLPAAMLAFGKLWPSVDLAIVEGSYTDLTEPLRHGEIDLLLGALREGPGNEDLDQRAIFEDRPAIIGSKAHPLFRERAPSAADLARYPWILPAAETPLRHYWEAMMRECGVEPPHVGIQCGSVIITRQLLLGSDALTLLSRDQLAVEIEAGLLEICDPPIPVIRTIGIVTRQGWYPTRPQAALLAILEGRSFAENDG